MKTYPLLQSQFGIFMEWIKEPTSVQYNLPVKFSFGKEIEADRLEKAILQVVSVRKEMRTSFVLQKGEPLQYYNEQMHLFVDRLKMTECEFKEYEKQFVQPFDLLSGEPLWRFSIIETQDRIYLLWDSSHIISDGTTFINIFPKDLLLAYDGEELILNADTLYNHAEEEQSSFGTDSYKHAATYYKDKFSDTNFITLSKCSTPESLTGRLIRESSYISLKEIDDWCDKNGIAVNLLFMAAFSIVMSRLCRETQIGYYTINHGRTSRSVRNVYGMFIKSVPIKVDVDSKLAVRDFIRGFQEELMDSVRNGCYPLNHFVRDLHLKPRISFGFQGSQIEENMTLGSRVYPLHQMLRDKVNSDLSCVIYMDSLNYEIRMESSDALNDIHTVRLVGESIRVCVLDMLSHPDATISELNIISEEEKQELISLGKGEELQYDKTKTFVDLFKKQAMLHPSSTAVVDEVSSISYSDLDKQSDALATALMEQGVETDSFVGVMLPRRKEFLVAVIAVFKSGGAYIPLDNEYPNERLLYMLNDSKAKVLITTREFFEEKSKEGDFKADNIIFIDEFDLKVNAEAINNSKPSSLAYMIYTSGSTGKPKGVMVNHKNLINLIHWLPSLEMLNPGDSCIEHPSFSFDASVFDLFPPLTCGCEVHILPSSIRQNLNAINEYIKTHGIVGLTLSTQLGMELLNTYDLPLRYMVMGGEKLKRTRPSNVKVINGYGPTEFTVCSSYHIVNQEKEYDNIPMGRPVPNSLSVIVDSDGNLQPKGISGELCLIGDQMSRGYWGRDELTKEKFVNCPFLQGEKMYHTGDLTRWNDDGELEYLGRIDNQVKLRGFRIEMGEIESRINSFDGIKSAVAEVKEVNGAQHLCAYYTSECEIDKEELIGYLSETLTDYMVPTAYLQLDELPLTPNGKVNRKALPVPELRAEEIVAPETEEEKSLFKIISKQLGTERFGVTTNLISMGLTSIGAIKLNIALEKKLKKKIKTMDIIQHPTVRELSRLFCVEKNKMKKYLKQTYYPLTENQLAFYKDWQENPQGLEFNIPTIFDVTNLDIKKLKDSLERVTDVHFYLKTHLAIKEGEVVQKRRDNEHLPIIMTNIDQAPDSTFFQKRFSTFNLLEDDLCRIEIIKSNKVTYLFLNFSHIIIDGTSFSIFLKDLYKVYMGENISAEDFSAYDYSLYQREWSLSAENLKSKCYFDNLLKGNKFTLYPLSDDTCKKKSLGEQMIEIERYDIECFCKNAKVTEHSFFISCITQALHCIMHEKNIVIGFESNCRTSFLENTVGMFLQTLPVISHDNDSSTIEIVQGINQQIFTTMKYENYSFFSCKNVPNIDVVYEDGLLDICSSFKKRDCTGEFDLELDTPQCPMLFYIYPFNTSYKIILDYDISLYSPKDVYLFLQTIKDFAEGIAILDKNKSVLVEQIR